MLVNVMDQTPRQQETLATILVKGQVDSTMLKALSVVATVCLLAALIAVSSLTGITIERRLNPDLRQCLPRSSALQDLETVSFIK